MQRPRPARRIEARAGTVEPPVAQNEGFQWRSECLAFEASNAPDRNSRTARHFDTKRVILTMWHGPLSIGEGHALGDEALGAGGEGGRDEVARTLVADSCIANSRLRHLGRIKALRQIGQLMDDDHGPSANERLAQAIRIEHIDDDGLDIDPVECRRLLRRARGADDGPVVGWKKRNQAPAYRTAGAGEEQASGRGGAPFYHCGAGLWHF